MNTTLWIAQGLTAAIFLFSGIMKSLLPEKKLVEMGQTGVEGLAAGKIKFIGISEILGALGLVLPVWLDVLPVLTPLAAAGLGVIMVLAARVHYQREEYKVIGVNVVLFALCVFVIWGRF